MTSSESVFCSNTWLNESIIATCHCIVFIASVNQVKVVQEFRAGVIEWRRGLICMFTVPCIINEAKV